VPLLCGTKSVKSSFGMSSHKLFVVVRVLVETYKTLHIDVRKIAHSLEPLLCAKQLTTANASKIVNVQLALKRRELCLLKPTVEQSSVSHFVLGQGANNDCGAQHTAQERSVQRPGDCES
jgi:hypothetical protein